MFLYQALFIAKLFVTLFGKVLKRTAFTLASVRRVILVNAYESIALFSCILGFSLEGEEVVIQNFVLLSHYSSHKYMIDVEI